MSPDLVVVGNLIVDDIVYPDGTTRMGQPGGACLYMGLTGSLWGLSVGLVSVAGSDFPRQTLTLLAERGVDLAGIRELDQPGLRTWLLYEGAVRRVVHHLGGSSHAAASPAAEDLPDSWRPEAIHLAPMPQAIQARQIADLRQRFGGEVLLSLDPFEPLDETGFDSWRSLLASTDVFFFGDDELGSAAAHGDFESRLRRLVRDCDSLVIHKRGPRGGIAYCPPKAQSLRWQARAREVVDVTGAGDAFACGLLAGLLAGAGLERSLARGVVSASFAIEKPGIEGLVEATPAEAADRLADWFGS